MEGYSNKLEPFLFKWRREARLLREHAGSYHRLGDEDKAESYRFQAKVIDAVLNDLLTYIELPASEVPDERGSRT